MSKKIEELKAQLVSYANEYKQFRIDAIKSGILAQPVAPKNTDDKTKVSTNETGVLTVDGHEHDTNPSEKKCVDGKSANLILVDIAENLQKMLKADGTKIEGWGSANNGAAFLASYQELQQATKETLIYQDASCTEKSINSLAKLMQVCASKLMQVLITFETAAVNNIKSEYKQFFDSLKKLLQDAQNIAKSQKFALLTVHFAALTLLPSLAEVSDKARNLFIEIITYIDKNIDMLNNKANAFINILAQYDVSKYLLSEKGQELDGLKSLYIALSAEYTAAQTDCKALALNTLKQDINAKTGNNNLNTGDKTQFTTHFAELIETKIALYGKIINNIETTSHKEIKSRLAILENKIKGLSNNNQQIDVKK